MLLQAWRFKPSLAPGPAPACSPSVWEVSLPWSQQMLVHHRAHMKKSTRALGPAHSPYRQFLPLPHAAIFGLFLCSNRKDQNSTMPSRAVGSSPACWGPGDSPSAPSLCPEPHIDVNAAEMFLVRCCCSFFSFVFLITNHHFTIPSYRPPSTPIKHRSLSNSKTNH